MDNARIDEADDATQDSFVLHRGLLPEISRSQAREPGIRDFEVPGTAPPCYSISQRWAYHDTLCVIAAGSLLVRPNWMAGHIADTERCRQVEDNRHAEAAENSHHS